MSKRKKKTSEGVETRPCVFCGEATGLVCADCGDPVCSDCVASTDPVLCPECHFFYVAEEVEELEDEDEEEDEL